jgi:hypothetical protein
MRAYHQAVLLPPDEQAALIASMQGHWKITTPTVDWQAPDAVNRGCGFEF